MPFRGYLRACMLGPFSCARLFATPQTVARQAPLSTGFSRHKYRSGLPFPTPGDLPDPGMKHVSPVPAGGFFTTSNTPEAHSHFLISPTHVVAFEYPSLQCLAPKRGTRGKWREVMKEKGFCSFSLLEVTLAERGGICSNGGRWEENASVFAPLWWKAVVSSQSVGPKYLRVSVNYSLLGIWIYGLTI